LHFVGWVLVYGGLYTSGRAENLIRQNVARRVVGRAA
jgi:hypothetical protein